MTRGIAIAVVVWSMGTARADERVTASSLSQDEDPHFVGDVRGALYVRDDNNFFHHAEKYNYDLPGTAGGVMITLGAAITPRIAVFGEAFYTVDGSNRDTARLRLSSGAIAAAARFAIVHEQVPAEHLLGEVALTGGFGHYYIKETYVDPSLSPMVFSTSGSSFGGFGGVEASMSVYSFRAVIAYAYHYAPATVDDRIRGSVDAGGHEISLGIGTRL